MSQKEISRLVIMARVKEVRMTIKEASKVLSLTYPNIGKYMGDI